MGCMSHTAENPRVIAEAIICLRKTGCVAEDPFTRWQDYKAPSEEQQVVI